MPYSNNTINNAHATPIYESFRVETYKRGEGKKIYKFDARSMEAILKGRQFANEMFKAGKKVTVYRLDKYEDGRWGKYEEKTADGRPDSEKRQPKKDKQTKATNSKKTAKTTKTENTKKNSKVNIDKLSQDELVALAKAVLAKLA